MTDPLCFFEVDFDRRVQACAETPHGFLNPFDWRIDIVAGRVGMNDHVIVLFNGGRLGILLRNTGPIQTASGFFSSTALGSRLTEAVPRTTHERLRGGDITRL